jgi:L-rhamnose-H+ transport protein
LNTNPLIGIPLHWLGGFASGSFYVPYRGVRRWSWETYWLCGGLFAWVICPWLFAGLLTRDLPGVLAAQSLPTLWWTYFFGLLWGLGGLTYGLTMRYLGLSLGTGIALGFCASCGTLLPPLFKLFLPSIPVAESLAQIASSRPGQITLAGVGVCLAGILVAALAGLAKERELTPEGKQAAVAEFAFGKGVGVATFCGILSACFAFALTAGNPISEASLRAGTNPIWTGLPKLVVLLTGGFTTNVVWCLILNRRNRSGYQYLGGQARPEHAHLTGSGGEAPAAPVSAGAAPASDLNIPLLRNYMLCAAAGVTWYLQFFFYTMGETKMGRYGFASWTLHMASIIIFATMWGWIFHEWKGSSRRAHGLVGAGIALLVLSTIVIGVGAWLKARA